MTTPADLAADSVTDESKPSQEMEFQTREVLTIASGHFVHDSFSAFVPPLLPLIREKLGTDYAATGGLTIFMQIPSLLNPFIGYAADKVSLRYFIILAPAVTATLSSLLGMADSYVLLALLLFVAGVSTAAFHAAGAGDDRTHLRQSGGNRHEHLHGVRRVGPHRRAGGGGRRCRLVRA